MQQLIQAGGAASFLMFLLPSVVGQSGRATRPRSSSKAIAAGVRADHGPGASGDMLPKVQPCSGETAKRVASKGCKQFAVRGKRVQQEQGGIVAR